MVFNDFLVFGFSFNLKGFFISDDLSLFIFTNGFKHCSYTTSQTLLSSNFVNKLKEEYEVILTENGEEAVNKTLELNPDLIIMDIMMPVLDGIHTMISLREEHNSIPIIFLSAKSEDTDKIVGLNLGADDYITKPFNPLELTARVKSALRRYTKFGSISVATNQYQTGGLVIDDDKKEVYVDNELIKLTPIEYNLLKLLVKNKGKVFSISEIYEQIPEKYNKILQKFSFFILFPFSSSNPKLPK